MIWLQCHVTRVHSIKQGNGKGERGKGKGKGNGGLFVVVVESALSFHRRSHTSPAAVQNFKNRGKTKLKRERKERGDVGATSKAEPNLLCPARNGHSKQAHAPTHSHSLTRVLAPLLAHSLVGWLDSWICRGGDASNAPHLALPSPPHPDAHTPWGPDFQMKLQSYVDRRNRSY